MGAADKLTPGESHYKGAIERCIEMARNNPRGVFSGALPLGSAARGSEESTRMNIVLNWFEELKERVPVP